MKHYSPTGRRNRGRPLKRLLDTWDRHGSTSRLTPWQTYDDDDKYPPFRNLDLYSSLAFKKRDVLYHVFRDRMLPVTLDNKALSVWNTK
jgi:hypothetical protein